MKLNQPLPKPQGWLALKAPGKPKAESQLCCPHARRPCSLLHPDLPARISESVGTNIHFHVCGLPWWLRNKEFTCNAGGRGDVSSIPGWGRSSGGNRELTTFWVHLLYFWIVPLQMSFINPLSFTPLDSFFKSWCVVFSFLFSSRNFLSFFLVWGMWGS